MNTDVQPSQDRDVSAKSTTKSSTQSSATSSSTSSAKDTNITKNVKAYYGSVLDTNEDLKTSACCPSEAPPPHIQALLNNIHPAVQEKFYGCGSPLPVAAEGCTILDLGCGSGRDVYLLSQLVGEQGEVIGIDMTEEQLTVARKHIDWHTEKFGYKSPNVRFKLGYIEDLTSIGIKDDSVDIIISNCVINLSPNKEAVFKEIFRVLKPGGELFFSDVFADRRIPEQLQLNPTLLGECLGGALYLGDFQRLMARVGLSDSRIISQRELTIDDPDIKAMAGMITFYSMTVRAFKLNLDESRENFAQVARYLGTIPECPDSFILDADLQFATEEPVPICSNTAMMLSKTRLAKHFKIHGDCDIHYGAFDPSPIPETDINLEQPSTGCC